MINGRKSSGLDFLSGLDVPADEIASIDLSVLVRLRSILTAGVGHSSKRDQ